MELSIIIPCLNAEATLPVQLDALCVQQWSRQWEVIIADNGSRDHSVDIALQYKHRFSSLTLVDASKKKGQSYARNYGIHFARADNLAFCDADDEVAPGWVASMGEALCSHEVVHGKFGFDKFNNEKEAAQTAKRWKKGLYQRQFLPGGGTGNLGIKRWVHEAIGGFDERIPRFEDSDYFWKLQLEGFKLHYVPEAVVQVRKERVNPSLGLLYRRTRTGAIGKHWLWKRYRHLGMLPNPPFKASLLNWIRTLKKTTQECAAMRLEELHLRQLAKDTGDVVGQLQGRFFTLCKPYHPGKIKRLED